MILVSFFLFNREGQGKKEATWRIFSLKELHAATNNFNYDNKLGEGSFGSVYWGQLWDGSQVRLFNFYYSLTSNYKYENEFLDNQKNSQVE